MKFLKLSALFNALFILEAAIAFCIDILIATRFGINPRTDGLYAAWMLPQAIGRGMFQSLTNSLMGLFDEPATYNQLGKMDQPHQRAYSEAITLIGCIVLPISLLLSLTSQWWLPLTIPGAASETQSFAIPQARILAWLIAMLGLTETCRAIYYREGKLWWPSSARIVGGFFAIGLIAWGGWMQNIQIVVWGLTIGAGIETIGNLLGLPWLLKFRPYFAWPSRSRFHEMTALISAPIGGMMIRLVATTAERALVSTLGPGAITLLAYANRIISSIERFVFRGFVLSIIYKAAGEGNRTTKRQLHKRLGLVCLIALPITVTLTFFAQPLVALLFGYGNFTAKDIETLATLLQAYGLAIIGIAISRVPYGYAYTSRKPSVIVIFFVIFSLLLFISEWSLLKLGMGLSAFGWGYTIAILGGFLWLYYVLVRSIQAN